MKISEQKQEIEILNKLKVNSGVKFDITESSFGIKFGVININMVNMKSI